MLPKIRVRVSSSQIRAYRNLLREDWSQTTLEDTLLLLKKLIAHDLDPETCSWQQVHLLEPVKQAPVKFDAAIISRIRDLSETLREAPIPKFPGQFTRNRLGRLSALAEESWAYLTLQSMADLHDETGQFADAQSILFLCAAHFLMPDLKNRLLKAERAVLANAMYIHTVLVWRTVPSHFHYLQSVLMDELGYPERRLELLEQSLIATSPDDHSYLTKATAYWSDLMDLRQYQKAGEFLLSLTRTAPRECQGEIQEMFRELMASTSRAPAK